MGSSCEHYQRRSSKLCVLEKEDPSIQYKPRVQYTYDGIVVLLACVTRSLSGSGLALVLLVACNSQLGALCCQATTPTVIGLMGRSLTLTLHTGASVDPVLPSPRSAYIPNLVVATCGRSDDGGKTWHLGFVFDDATDPYAVPPHLLPTLDCCVVHMNCVCSLQDILQRMPGC